MPRLLLLGALLALLLATPAQAACPGADPCPYTASAVVGQRSSGVLRFPQAVAVGPDGSVYVADGADRIDRFAQDGTLLDSWGSTGSAPGEFRFGAGGGNDSGAGG